MMYKILSTLGFISFLGLTGLVGTFEGTYVRNATCTSCNENVYSFTDTCGYVWEWEAETNEVFNLNENYKLIMDSCHSSSIFDDEIKKIKKSIDK